MTLNEWTEPVAGVEKPVLDVFGVQVRVLVGGGESGGACSIARLTCPKGTGAPPHRHAHAENFYVVRGVLTVQRDEKTLQLLPGQLVHVAPGRVHAFQNAGDEEVEFLAMATPAGHELFFRDADALARSGQFTPENAAALCQSHGIELVR